MSLKQIKVEDEVFVSEGTRGVGAVRAVRPDHLLVNFEGYGDVELRAENIAAAHDGKVIVRVDTLPPHLQDLLPRVHSGETRA